MSEITLREFFGLIVGPTGDQTIDLRAIITKGKAAETGQFNIDDEEDIEAFVERWNGKANVYFGILPRPILPDGSINVFWVDMDFKDYAGGEAEARAKLEAFSPKPHVVVFTGNGLHLYWMIEPGVPVKHTTAWLKPLAAKLGGDPVSTDPSRIFRVPGTANIKYDHKPVAVVEVFDKNAGVTPYGPSEFGLEVSVSEPAQTKSREDYVRSEAAYQKAIGIVKDWPPSVAGHQGDNNLYRLGARICNDLALSIEDAIEVINTKHEVETEFGVEQLSWNDLCVPPWTNADIRKIIGNSDEYSKGSKGSDDPAEEFADITAEDEVSPPKTDPSEEEKLSQMDQKYIIVDNAGVEVYAEATDQLGPHWRSYSVKQFIEAATYAHKFGKKKIGKLREVTMAQYWLESKRPTQQIKHAIVFDPSNEHDADHFNLYRGLGVQPIEGDWTLLQELMFDILAGKDQKVFDYIMNWCAYSVQKPWIKPRTTLMFRGIEGNGKSLFGQMFVDLFGRHGMRIDSPERLNTKFNAFFRDLVGVFVDEAFFSGDSKHEGIFKSLVTDMDTSYEEKFKNVTMGKSFIRMIVATNNERIVRAYEGSRRWVVMGVEEKKDPSFYSDLVAKRHQIKQAWLHSLLNRDLTNFDPANEKPLTEAYRNQIIINRDPVDAWVYDWVESGYNDNRAIAIGSALYPDRIFSKKDIRDLLVDYLKKRGERIYERADTTYIGMRLKKLLPTIASKQAMQDGERINVYVFPPVAEARKTLGITDEPVLDESDELI